MLDKLRTLCYIVDTLAIHDKEKRKMSANEQYIIKREQYTELNRDDERIYELYNPEEEARPRYHIPAIVNDEVAWVIDSSNMYMEEMLNWREHWQRGNFDHGVSHEEYASYSDVEKRDMARWLAVDCNTDFDEFGLSMVYYTEDTIEEIMDIIVSVWDAGAEHALSDE